MFIKETEPFLAPFCFYKVANSGYSIEHNYSQKLMGNVSIVNFMNFTL